MPEIQLTLPEIPPPLPSRARVKPILRWAGGKRDLVPVIAGTAYVYLQKSGGRYIEPFLGGGAVALDLGLPDMILADLCAPLVQFYEEVHKSPTLVAHALKVYADRGIDAETYKRIRAERPTSNAMRAARFLYLNTLCFNGIYRENSKGEFNVPYGGRKRDDQKKAWVGTHNFRTLEDLQAFAAAIATSQLLCQDFRATLALAGPGDFVYCDPPYYGVYDDYTAGGFGKAAHVILAEETRCAYDRGADILLTNADTPEVREMYSWAALQPTGEYRRVNRDATKRGKVGCLIITTVPDLLGAASSS